MRCFARVVLAFSVIVALVSYSYSRGACVEKKCLEITKYGYLVMGTKFCYEFQEEDCLKCHLYWCLIPSNGKIPNKVCTQTTANLHCRDCISSTCTLECLANTNSDQQASCTGTGNYAYCGRTVWTCQDPPST